jgi:hypothetical protein
MIFFFFFFFRYALKNIPTTFIGLEKWLQELWREKDQLLENVYNEGLRFPANSSRQILPQPILPLQYVTLFAWFAFIFFVFNNLFSLTCTSCYMWLWIILVSGTMAAISEYTDGLQEIEILLDQNQFWNKIWKTVVSSTLGKLKWGSKNKSE